MLKYTAIPESTFEELQLNAGIIVDTFSPATGEYGNILYATSGGITFTDAPTYSDFGEDIDGCPKNTKELKKITDRTITLGATVLNYTPARVKALIAAASIDTLDATHIVPRDEVLESDFADCWWVGSYSDKNGVQNGGYIAIHLLNMLSTGGFTINATDKAKGKSSVTWTAHYSLNAQNTVPYEMFIKAGEAETGDYSMSVRSTPSATTTGDTVIEVSAEAGSGQTFVYQTGYNLVAPYQGIKLVGTAWTAWDGEDEITAITGMDIVVAIIDSDGKSVHAGKTTVYSKESE